MHCRWRGRRHILPVRFGMYRCAILRSRCSLASLPCLQPLKPQFCHLQTSLNLGPYSRKVANSYCTSDATTPVIHETNRWCDDRKCGRKLWQNLRHYLRPFVNRPPLSLIPSMERPTRPRIYAAAAAASVAADAVYRQFDHFVTNVTSPHQPSPLIFLLV